MKTLQDLRAEYLLYRLLQQDHKPRSKKFYYYEILIKETMTKILITINNNYKKGENKWVKRRIKKWEF